ncbi:MAG TPA: 2-oxo acid dehydrogenase subunit E2, partial [Micropepsaceae bacterium]
MSIEIKVPAMGESVTEATIARWLKKEGDSVNRDEPLVELETDKVNVEVPSPAAGVLEHISIQQGGTVGVGTVLGAVAEGAAAAKPSAQPESAKPAKAKTPEAKSAPAPAAAAAPPPPPPPSVRRIAEEEKLDLSTVAGSGKRGQITKADALAALEAVKTPMSAPPVRASAPSPRGDREERVPMSRLRKTIALRLKESQDIAAQLTTFNEVDMSKLMALRMAYKDGFEKKHGVKLGFMGFFVKACIAALKEIPAVNAEIDGDDIVYKNYFDIGVAVST